MLDKGRDSGPPIIQLNVIFLAVYEYCEYLCMCTNFLLVFTLDTPLVIKLNLLIKHFFTNACVLTFAIYIYVEFPRVVKLKSNFVVGFDLYLQPVFSNNKWKMYFLLLQSREPIEKHLAATRFTHFCCDFTNLPNSRSLTP